MKRKSIISVIVSAIMALAGYFGYANHHTELSDIQLANIEALSYGEFIVGEGWECFKTVFDDVTNPMFYTIIHCKNCNTVSAVYFSNNEHCTYTGMYGR